MTRSKRNRAVDSQEFTPRFGDTAVIALIDKKTVAINGALISMMQRMGLPLFC